MVELWGGGLGVDGLGVVLLVAGAQVDLAGTFGLSDGVVGDIGLLLELGEPGKRAACLARMTSAIAHIAFNDKESLDII